VTRIAVLGGSAVSTPQLADAVAAAGTTDVELALVGRSKRKLALVATASRTAGRGRVVVSEHAEAESALDGASIVLSQIRVGGLEGRAFDEEFSRDLGVPGEETVGPGGFSSAWRTLPVVRELARRIRRSAPDALVLNLTNPASMVHRVLAEAGLSAITVCDAPLVLARRLGALLGLADAAVATRYVGLNHCGWLTGIEIDDRDRLDELVARPAQVSALTGVDEEVIAWLGIVPNPYLKYLYHPDRELAAQLGKRGSRARELEQLEGQALAEYARDGDPAPASQRRPAPWYSACVVPLVVAFLEGASVRTVVNVGNRGLLPFLPDEVTVEIAAHVERGHVEPLPPATLPPDARALLLGVAAYDRLAVEAILAGDREGCVRALAAHPLVCSVGIARELVRRIEHRHGPLPEAEA
jgi:6-phospho-beta-glucosidase